MKFKIILLLLGCMLFTNSCYKKRTPKTVLHIYTAMENDEIDDYYQLWKQHHSDIELKFHVAPTYKVQKRLTKALNCPDGGPDIVFGCSTDCLIDLDKQSLLEGFTLKDIEILKNRFIDKTNTPPHWAAAKGFVGVMITNQISFKRLKLTLPTSFDDLIKPEYRNRIAMPDPLTSGTGLHFICGIIHKKGEKAGWEYLEKLFRNLHILTQDGSEPTKLAARGDDGIAIGISFAYRGFREKSKGAPINIIFPDEPTFWGLDANAIIHKPNIKPEVYKFMNWAFSKQMTECYIRRYPLSGLKNSFAIAQNLKTDYPKHLNYKLINNGYIYWQARNYKKIQDEWKKRFGKRHIIRTKDNSQTFID